MFRFRRFLWVGWLFLHLLVQFASYGQDVKTQKFDWNDLVALDQEKLSKMSLDNPLLRTAYAQSFLRIGKPAESIAAVRKDLIRRGNEAVPLLLSLFDEDPEGSFRADLMSNIETVPSIDLEPFLERARLLFQQEGLKMERRTCYGMAWLFERHGSPADLEILKQLNSHGYAILPNIQRMERRLGQTQKPVQALAAATPVQPPILVTSDAKSLPAPRAATVTPNSRTVTAETPSRKGSHSILVLITGIVIVALAIVSLLLKRRFDRRIGR